MLGQPQDCVIVERVMHSSTVQVEAVDVQVGGLVVVRV